MTEFTYATGEADVIGDRFSPSVVLFWLKTSGSSSPTSRDNATRKAWTWPRSSTRHRPTAS